MAGWWNVVDQMGVDRPAQYRNVGRRRTGYGSYGLGAQQNLGSPNPTTKSAPPASLSGTLTEQFNGFNAPASGYRDYASMVQNQGGAALSYYDYASAANTGADVKDIPVQVNGIPTMVPMGTAGWNLGAPITSNAQLGPVHAPPPEPRQTANTGTGVQINQTQQDFVRDRPRRRNR